MKTEHVRSITTLACAVFLVTGVIALAACGGSDDNGAADSDGLTTISVGVIPAADVAPLYVGVEQGFFEEEGLEVEPEMLPGGAAAVPAVLNGSLQFAEANVVSMILGVSQELPLKIVAPAASGGDSPDEDYGVIAVSGDSDIESIKDLAGKTIASNTLENIVSLSAQVTVEAAGVAQEDIELVEIPFPDMPGALANGRVDAIATVEPFVKQVKDEGARILSPLFYPVEPRVAVSGWFTSTQYTEENPEVTAAFQAALEKSQAYSQENPDEVREVIPSFTGVDQETADESILPVFESTLNLDSLDLLQDHMVDFGLMESKQDVTELTLSP